MNDPATSRTRRRFTWFQMSIAGTILIVLLGCLGGFGLPLEFIVYLASGWAFFLFRVLPQVEVDAGAIFFSGCALLLFVGGLQWLLRSLFPPSAERSGWQFRWTLSATALTLLMFIAGISFVGATHQATWLLTSKEPILAIPRMGAQRMQSGNNLKQQVLAIQNYQDMFEVMPPGVTFDSEGRQLHSWMTLILPFCEQEPLFDRIDLKKSWDDPAQGAAFRTRLRFYQSPYSKVRELTDSQQRSLSHYAGNAYVIGGSGTRKLTDISDGTANTIVGGEAAGNYVPWGQPGNWRDPALGINRTGAGFGSANPRGAMFSFADGHVQLLENNIAPEVLKALATPAGGEAVPQDF